MHLQRCLHIAHVYCNLYLMAQTLIGRPPFTVQNLRLRFTPWNYIMGFTLAVPKSRVSLLAFTFKKQYLEAEHRTRLSFSLHDCYLRYPFQSRYTSRQSRFTEASIFCFGLLGFQKQQREGLLDLIEIIWLKYLIYNYINIKAIIGYIDMIFRKYQGVSPDGLIHLVILALAFCEDFHTFQLAPSALRYCLNYIMI